MKWGGWLCSSFCWLQTKLLVAPAIAMDFMASCVDMVMSSERNKRHIAQLLLSAQRHGDGHLATTRLFYHQRSAMEWIAPGGEWLLLLLLLLPRVNNAIVDDTLRLIQTTTIIISDMQICSLYSSIFFVCSSLLSCSTIKMNVCTVWRLHTLN